MSLYSEIHMLGIIYPKLFSIVLQERNTLQRTICLLLLEQIARALHRKMWKNKDTLFQPQLQDSLFFLSYSHCLISDQNIQAITISDGPLQLVSSFFSTLWSHWHLLLWPSCKATGQQPDSYSSWDCCPPTFQKDSPKTALTLTNIKRNGAISILQYRKSTRKGFGFVFFFS